MEPQAHQLHVFFFPFMANGHIIPMIDIARLFAVRGTKCTLVTTPHNTSLFSKAIDQGIQAGLDISAAIIPFPAAEVGLPEGCESYDYITTLEMDLKFIKALTLLQHPFDQLLEKVHPDCIVADMFFTWASDVGSKHGIPTISFHGSGFFSWCLSNRMKDYNIESVAETFMVSGLPDQIEMTRSHMKTGPYKDAMDGVEKSEQKCFGVLWNTFYELEPAYVELYKEVTGRRAWSIGPVSLYNTSVTAKTQRGKRSMFDEHRCLEWLDSKEPNSVIYISFGSISLYQTAQFHEIAMGLEASEVPFIWVVRLAKNKEHEEILPRGFEKRVEGKGLIIKDWAPQMLILDHPAVGGFMTHCGWNSTLEGITAGLPMITWPVFAEQFDNEKLVTQVLDTGISAGNGVWSLWIIQENVTVTKEMVKTAVTQLMSKEEEAADRRRRARKLGEMAKRAVDEGGSSYNDLTALLEELRLHRQKSGSNG
ncbi:hypothetical protein ACHQM5_022898 [Ranunculus cassubicifolius]